MGEQGGRQKYNNKKKIRESGVTERQMDNAEEQTSHTERQASNMKGQTGNRTIQTGNTKEKTKTRRCVSQMKKGRRKALH